MSKLHHRNVITFYGASAQPPHLYLVTEWMERGRCESRVKGLQKKRFYFLHLYHLKICTYSLPVAFYLSPSLSLSLYIYIYIYNGGWLCVQVHVNICIYRENSYDRLIFFLSLTVFMTLSILRKSGFLISHWLSGRISLRFSVCFSSLDLFQLPLFISFSFFSSSLPASSLHLFSMPLLSSLSRSLRYILLRSSLRLFTESLSLSLSLSFSPKMTEAIP